MQARMLCVNLKWRMQVNLFTSIAFRAVRFMLVDRLLNGFGPFFCRNTNKATEGRLNEKETCIKIANEIEFLMGFYSSWKSSFENRFHCGKKKRNSSNQQFFLRLCNFNSVLFIFFFFTLLIICPVFIS